MNPSMIQPSESVTQSTNVPTIMIINPTTNPTNINTISTESQSQTPIATIATSMVDGSNNSVGGSSSGDVSDTLLIVIVICSTVLGVAIVAGVVVYYINKNKLAEMKKTERQLSHNYNVELVDETKVTQVNMVTQKTDTVERMDNTDDNINNGEFENNTNRMSSVKI